MSDRWTLLGEAPLKQLWRWEKERPDGIMALFFCGRNFVTLSDGTKKQTPEEPFFDGEAAGRQWLTEG
jgi:hypothetical protein